MKRTFLFTSLIAFSASMLSLSLSLMPSVQASEKENKTTNRFKCTLANLNGNYGVLANGYLVYSGNPSIPIGPVASIGRYTVNGDSIVTNSITATLKDNFNGLFIPPNELFAKSSGRITSLNTQDCTGEIAIVNNFGEARFTFVVVNQGNEIQFMRTGGTLDNKGIIKTVITGVAKRQ